MRMCETRLQFPVRHSSLPKTFLRHRKYSPRTDRVSLVSMGTEKEILIKDIHFLIRQTLKKDLVFIMFFTFAHFFIDVSQKLLRL